VEIVFTSLRQEYISDLWVQDITDKLDTHTSVIGMVGHIHARYLAKDVYIIYVCDYLTYWALVQDFSKLLPIYYYMVDATPSFLPSWDRMSNY
jgi:hypothetical protein